MNISTKTIIKFWLVPAVLILLGIFLYQIRIGLIIVSASILFAVALNPIVSKIAQLFPSKSRTLGTAGAYILVIGVLASILVFAIPPITAQVATFFQDVSVTLADTLEDWREVDLINDEGFAVIVENSLASLQEHAVSFAANLPSFIIGSAGSIFSMLSAAAIVIFTTFLMLVQGPAILEAFWAKFGSDPRATRTKAIIGKMSVVFTRFVNSQLLVALISGISIGLIVLILSLIFRLPMTLVVPLGLLSATLGLIPLFGTITAGFIATTMIALSSLPAAIIFLVAFMIYQQIENNFISPTVQARTSPLPALVILCSVTIGIYFAGVPGAILAIPVVGCLKVLFDEFFPAKQKPKTAETTKPK